MALQTGDQHVILGGTTSAERALMRRQRQVAHAVAHARRQAAEWRVRPGAPVSGRVVPAEDGRRRRPPAGPALRKRRGTCNEPERSADCPSVAYGAELHQHRPMGGCGLSYHPGGTRPGSGRRLRLELVGQLADLGRRVAPVATKGLQERELALLGPSRHGLGRPCKMSATSAGWRYRGPSGAALPLGGAATAHPSADPDGGAGPGVEQEFVRSRQQGAAPAMLLAATLSGAGRTGRACRPTRLPAIVCLGRFSVSAS
jgi:hypothetical protein